MAMAMAITVAEVITMGGVEAITTDGAIIIIDENINPFVVILKHSASQCGSDQPWVSLAGDKLRIRSIIELRPMMMSGTTNAT
jgi:hypothetical protein